MKAVGLARVLSTLVISLVLSAACSSLQPVMDTPSAPTAQEPAAQPTLTPLQPLAPTTLPAETQAATQQPETALGIWVSPDVPAGLQAGLNLPPVLRQSAQPGGADLRVVVGGQYPISEWVFALVAPFPTILDNVSAETLHGFWQGDAPGPFEGAPLLMAEETRATLASAWGPPADGSVRTLPADELRAEAWETRPSWAVVPFESLEPRWKVLELDGQSPIRRNFESRGYPLAVQVSLEGGPDLVDAVAALYGPGSEAPLLPGSNRDPERMTILVMTGVTALVRSTAWTMERQGMVYPARDIGEWLREADITHISNEVPFARDCPYPNPVQEDLIFCSDPRYIELLEDIGTDIVELTGDHFQDWGPQAMLDTLELYRERGWPYYGGGANLEEARRPVIIEDHGNRVGFIGCNGKGGYYASAGPDRPGATRCDFDYMSAQITRLVGEGVVPVTTFQHFEYYTFAAPPNQVADFRNVAAAGSAIVSGSQAHHPQVMEFFEGAFIHYGLGNLFFDQIFVSRETARAFIDRHVIYAGRHISTELLTIQFEDYARSRPMFPEEKASFLQVVFSASGWGP